MILQSEKTRVCRTNNVKTAYCVAGVFSRALILFLMFCNSDNAFAETVHERFTVDINNSSIVFSPGSLHVGFAMMFGSGNPRIPTFLNTPLNNIDIKKVSERIFHLRNNAWKDFYWKIDCGNRRVYRVRDGSFGAQGGTETPLDSIIVIVGQTPSNPILLNFKQALLAFDSATKESRFSVESDDILPDNEWEIQRVSSRIYHFRFMRFANSIYFFKIDADLMKAFLVNWSGFGTEGGIENPISWKVQSAKVTVPTPPKPAIMEDIEMAKFNGDHPVSVWFENEKALYREVLKHESYDVLVVPFQVQEYAFDRIGRSLMTRYLVHRIESTTNKKIPSPTLVAKALGELQRTFSDKDVYQLANDLKVKTLIKSHVGHNRDERMKLTIVVQARDEQGNLSVSTPMQTLEWNDIPFSDEQLPSEVFLGMLDGIMAKLPFKQTAKIEPRVFKKEKQLAVPASLAKTISKNLDSPVLRAYYLQLLGALYPQATWARDYLFERSLVALTDVSPKSPDYPLLKARAYYYLYRRPAALAALKNAPGPQEKGLVAALNGNLLELEKTIDAMKDPLPKLLAQIERVDLKAAYDEYFNGTEMAKQIATSLPAWKEIILCRFGSLFDSNSNSWVDKSNLPIKVMLDDLLPVENYTAKDIAVSQIALGDDNMENDKIDFSVYTHTRKLLEKDAGQFLDNESDHLVKRDIIDLMDAIGESNLFERLTVSAIFQRNLARIERYNTIYRDHPLLVSLKRNIVSVRSAEKQGLDHENLKNQAYALGRNACYWLQGQFNTMFAVDSCRGHNLFDGDYPRRWYWNEISNETPGDRSDGYGYFKNRMYTTASEQLVKKLKNLDMALQYATGNFRPLEIYHRVLIENNMIKEAELLTATNWGRFVGHPSHWTYFAEYKEKTGDTAGAQKLCENAIAIMPEEWKPYEQLGKLYIKQGKPAKAADMLRNYPGFKTATNIKNDNWVKGESLANKAFRIAQSLFACGDLNEAKYFYELSSAYSPDSDEWGIGRIMLSMMSNDYFTAAQALREMANRTNFAPWQSRYASLLHAMGFHDQAWAIFNNNNLISSLHFDEAVEALVVGLHTDIDNDGKEREWWSHLDFTKVDFPPIQNAFLTSHLTDRAINDQLSAQVVAFDRQFIESNATKQRYKEEWEIIVNSQKKKRSWAAWFADAYDTFRKHDYASAYSMLSGATDAESCNNFRCSGNRSFVLPYAAWSAFKSGHEADVTANLKYYKGKYGETSDYHIALALLDGGKKNHRDALAHLKAARFNMPDADKDMRPLSAWYQLLEAYELLYEDSGNSDYHVQMLEIAKICQTLFPLYGWPYAFEAKYTAKESERVRALAMTLYLDKRSERISGFSDQEKQKALEWLKKNNPFFRASPKGSKSEA